MTVRALRVTAWTKDPEHPHAMPSPVVFDTDLRDTIESLLAQTEQDAAKDGLLVTHEVREFPDGTSLVEASVAMGETVREAINPVDGREWKMALTYNWLAHMLERVKPDGLLSGTEPWPLTVEDLMYVFGWLLGHPNYRGQTVVGNAEDGTEVKIRAGELEQEDKNA